MRRRKFIGAVGAASSIGLAGCLGDEPELRIPEFRQPAIEPQQQHVEVLNGLYSYTIMNEGDDGNIRSELFFFEDSSTPDPTDSALYGGDEHPGITFDSSTEFFLASGETHTIEMEARELQDEEEVGIVSFPATRGAVIDNTGGSGEIEVHLEIQDSGDLEVEDPEPKSKSIGSNEELLVEFNVVVPQRARYEVYAEPV